MDQQKVDMFIMANKKYFPEDKIIYIRDRLKDMDDEKFSLASCISFKDPTTVLLVSIFLGCFGVDRFMIGNVGIGILKLLTFGCAGILTIIDWLTITKKVKELNYNKIIYFV